MTRLMTWLTRVEAWTASAGRTRGVISARRGIALALLGAVLGARLLAIVDAGGVERVAHDLVADARQILDTPTAHEHDRVLLQVVADARDVAGDLHAVGEAHACDLAQGRVRLLGRDRVHARADASLLGRALERGGLGLRVLRRARMTHELIDGRHAASCRLGQERKGERHGRAHTNGPRTGR